MNQLFKNSFLDKVYKLSFILAILGILNCQKRIFKKEEVYHLNEYYKNKTYYLKENLTISNKETLSKGTSVKIWIESTPTIFKLKCYPSTIDREVAIGKMVTYLVNEDIRGSDFTLESIEELIDNKLIYYDPKEVVKAKTGKK